MCPPPHRLPLSQQLVCFCTDVCFMIVVFCSGASQSPQVPMFAAMGVGATWHGLCGCQAVTLQSLLWRGWACTCYICCLLVVWPFCHRRTGCVRRAIVALCSARFTCVVVVVCRAFLCATCCLWAAPPGSDALWACFLHSHVCLRLTPWCLSPHRPAAAVTLTEGALTRPAGLCPLASTPLG